MQASRTRNEYFATALLFALLSAVAFLYSAHASLPAHTASAVRCSPEGCPPYAPHTAKSTLPTRHFTRRHFAQNTAPPSLRPFEAALPDPAPKPHNLRLPPSPVLPNSSVPVALRQRAP